MLAALAAGGPAAQAQPAEATTPQADFTKAMDYDLGITGPPNLARAFALYQRAADAGLPAAALNVAVMYDSGRGTAADKAQAAIYYAVAASQGLPRAAYDLGQLYADGDGVPRNDDLAQAWLHQAATQGVTAAWARLRQVRRTRALPDPDSSAPAPQPKYPPAGAVLPPHQNGISLVWTAAPAAAPSLYFVEVAALDGAKPETVFTRMTNLSAAATPLGREPGRYAWRVFTVSQPIGHYAPSPWTPFSVT